MQVNSDNQSLRSPFVSIVTVCFNAREELKKTLDSVQENRFALAILTHGEAGTAPLLEQIVIDGASTDGTPVLLQQKVAEGIIQQGISEPDKGIYDAMNKGLARARGTYVLFMNAGDTFRERETLRKLYLRVLTSGEAPDIIYGDTMIVDNEGRDLHPRHHQAPQRLTKESYLRGMLICHQSFYAKRSLAPEYDLRYRLSSDFDWCLKIIEQSQSSLYIPEYLTSYLSEGATTQHRWHSLWERFRIMRRHFGCYKTLKAHAKILLRSML